MMRKFSEDFGADLDHEELNYLMGRHCYMYNNQIHCNGQLLIEFN